MGVAIINHFTMSKCDMEFNNFSGHDPMKQLLSNIRRSEEVNNTTASQRITIINTSDKKNLYYVFFRKNASQFPRGYEVTINPQEGKIKPSSSILIEFKVDIKTTTRGTEVVRMLLGHGSAFFAHNYASPTYQCVAIRVESEPSFYWDWNDISLENWIARRDTGLNFSGYARGKKVMIKYVEDPTLNILKIAEFLSTTR